jgi:hypothetical protein
MGGGFCLCFEGGLTADRSPSDAPGPNCGSWLACEDAQPANQSPSDAPGSNCGSWLACEDAQPAHQSPSDAPGPNCGSWLACEDAEPANQSPSGPHRSKLWERACSRRLPVGRSISPECIQSNGESELYGQVEPSHRLLHKPGRPAGRLVFDVDAPPSAMDGRWRRAHGAGPERGHAEPGRGTERKGQKRLVTWRFSK